MSTFKKGMFKRTASNWKYDFQERLLFKGTNKFITFFK
jgi:hypothetical protein